jgi:membrane dipeptidase
MLIVDAHEDLAWNILALDRDYTLSVDETRQHEHGTETPLHNGDTLLGWPDYQRGCVAVVFSTLFASPLRARPGEWDTQCYTNISQANAIYRAQVDVYHRLVDDHPDKFRLIHTKEDMLAVLSAWQNSPNSLSPEATGDKGVEGSGKPVGLVMLMEGAEGVRDPGELEEWWGLGVRIIAPAWRGTRFCGGTHEPGPLTKEGYALMEGMADLGFALDLSHMDVKAALQALDAYPGSVIASHANAAALLKGADTNRHLPNEVIRGLIEHDGVIGVVPYNRFLLPNWRSGDRRDMVNLHLVVAQIDYICQMAGDARHIGLGSDFDGGFGVQSVPVEIDTIADMQKLIPLLAEKGYTEDDTASILGLNWISQLHKILPQ